AAASAATRGAGLVSTGLVLLTPGASPGFRGCRCCKSSGPRECDPRPSRTPTPEAKLAFAPQELPNHDPPVALEGDHATCRTVGSEPGPDQPSGEARCVVPRPQGDGARGRPRGEPATGDGAAHLPPDPPVSSHDVVGRDPAPQGAAPAGELGIDLRRVPEL